MRASRAGLPNDPLFPTRAGKRLSRDAVALRLRKHILPALGNRELRAIKPSTIQALLRNLDVDLEAEQSWHGEMVSAISAVAAAFGAQRTPHAYVFDGTGSLVYVGTIDDSPGDPANVKQQYLRQAVDAVQTGDVDQNAPGHHLRQRVDAEQLGLQHRRRERRPYERADNVAQYADQQRR